MKKLLVLLIFTLLFVDAFPQKVGVGVGVGFKRNKQQEKAAYYVSATGSDLGNGLTPATAFATLTKVNSLNLTGSINQVLFKAGDEWTGTITVNNSGTAQKQITYGSYGTGAKPKIYGSKVLTGFTRRNVGVDVWVTKAGAVVNQVFVAGRKIGLAKQSPDWQTITAVTSQTNITVGGISSGGTDYYRDCVIMTRTTNWLTVMRTVTASTGNTLTLSDYTSTHTDDVLLVNQKILVFGKREFVDSENEFYYNTSTDSLYLYSGVNPNTLEIRGSNTSIGLNVGVNDYIKVKNIEFLQQADYGVAISGVGTSTNVTIDNCEFTGQYQYGIYSEPTTATNLTVSNNVIKNPSSSAIYVRNIGNSIFSGNTVSKVGLMAEVGANGVGRYGNGNGITVMEGTGSGTNTIERNRVDSTNYNGIRFTGTANVRYNYITNNQIHKGDGGGIYTEYSPGGVISYNIVDGSVGSSEGRPNGTLMDGNGVYLDEVAENITVLYNTSVNNSGYGIIIHRGSGHTVKYNNVLNNRASFIIKGGVNSTINKITNNFFATGSASHIAPPYRQALIKVGPSYAQEVVYANIDSNKYVNAFNASSDLVFSNQPVSGVETFYNFGNYKSITNYDAVTTLATTGLNTNETQRLIYNPTNSTATYYLNNAQSVKDSANAAINSSFSLGAYRSKYVRAINPQFIQPYSDVTAPTMTAFSVPSTVTGLTIAVSSFTTSADAAAYIITESAPTPALALAGWSTVKPTTYTLSSSGAKTLYAWCRDAAGNVSSSLNAATTASYNTTTLATGLIAAYDFNETSGLLQDVSGNALHATSHDANITINQSGSPGQAYTFAGSAWNNARTIVADNNLLTFSNEMSIFIWLPELTSIDKNHALVYKGATSNFEYKIIITSANKVQFNLYQAGTGTTIQVTGSTVLTTGTRYFIECSTSNVLSQAGMRININNVAETLTLGGTSTITSMLNGTGTLMFGGESLVGTWLNGKISQILIYGRLLTASEKQALYNDGSGINKANW